MEEHMISAASPGFGARGAKWGIDCEALKAMRPRPYGGLNGRPIRPWPLNFTRNVSREISTDSKGILLKYIPLQNLSYPFPEEN